MAFDKSNTILNNALQLDSESDKKNSSIPKTDDSLNATPKVFFITMGCAKNEVDTAHMKELVLSAGYFLVDDAIDADVVVVNTCSFIETATKESLDVIFDVAKLPRYLEGHIKLVVAGCMPARYSQDLADELKEATVFLPCDEEENIAGVLEDLVGKPILKRQGQQQQRQHHLTACDSTMAHTSPTDGILPSYTPTAGPYSAYVKISDGCDRFCSYCSIPYIRGRYRSFSYDGICAEIDKAQVAGVKEIVLIAQDTGKWGSDFDKPSSLSWLLEALANRYAHLYFRVMYLQPEEIDDTLLDVMKSYDNIIKYLDIPLQHVNSRLIKDMNRIGSRSEFEQLLDHIKNVIPNITLRTTLIAGFPGESDDDFEELCDFCEQGMFDYVGVFAYSREEGTRAFDLPDQLDGDEKQRRAQRLTDIVNTVSASKIKGRVGEQVSVLVEGVNEEGNIFGRAFCQAPEVDGITFLDCGEAGDIVNACVVDSLFFDMEAEVVCEENCDASYGACDFELDESRVL